RSDGEIEAVADFDASLAAYGEPAALLLGACRHAWLPKLPAIVESYCAALLGHEGIGSLLGALPSAALGAFRGHMLRHLQYLLSADLDLASHRARAIRNGLFHAACGLEEVWLLEAIEQLRDNLAGVLVGPGQGDRRALA